MTIAAVENAARHAWPAIEEQQRPYGILRFAHGYTRRANSLALFDAPAAGYEDLVADCELFFSSRSQPVMIRLPHFPVMMGLDCFLNARGYTTEAPSLVMVHNLTGQSTDSADVLRLDRESWLDNFYSLSGQSKAQRIHHELLISRIESEINFAVINNNEGIPTSCALAIHYNGVVGIYNVATASNHRRQHWASHLISALLGWSREVGASATYLQVEQSNDPAIKLYSKCGFSELYRYSYKVKEPLTNYGYALTNHRFLKKVIGKPDREDGK